MHWQTMGKIASAAALALVAMAAPMRMAAQAGSDTVLKAAEVQKLLPASVFYCGHSAPAELRNSGGVKFADGHYVLATLVETSGYSTGIAAKYQAYFVAEVPLTIGGQSLAAGVYGVGFIADNKFVVTDIGAHDVLTVSSTNDAAMRRPLPLQVTADPGGGFRLYAGRNYVSFSR
ncbi:MAG: hypothetical protein WBE72_23070 [Terracidiphilus sp.]